MTYRITGLSPEPFLHLIGANEVELARANAVRVTANADRGFPCRITLEDAKTGETLILVNHVSHDVATPYRASHAIFVREAYAEPSEYCDATPPAFEQRVLSLRGFGVDGMMRDAKLAQPGEADGVIRALFADGAIAYIHAHNAGAGCFAAKVERH